MITQEQLPMVAIPSMNDTHLEDMLIINRLSRAAEDGNVEDITKVLNELLEHTITHFSDEEQMMQEAEFPAYQTHKDEHERHLKELKHLIKYFNERKDPKAVTAYVDGNLSRWMIHHIQTMDTMTAMFLKENLSN